MEKYNKRITAAIQYIDENLIDKLLFDSKNTEIIDEAIKIYNSLNSIIYSSLFEDVGFIHKRPANFLKQESEILYNKIPNLTNIRLAKIIAVLHNLIMVFYLPKK